MSVSDRLSHTGEYAREKARGKHVAVFTEVASSGRRAAGTRVPFQLLSAFLRSLGSALSVCPEVSLIVEA